MKKHKPVQSLQRGIKMLERVAEIPTGASLQELAAAIECSSPAAYHMAQTLVAAGYLERSESPVRYTLGGKLFELTRHQQNRSISAAVDDALLAIQEQLPGASAYYCQGRGSDILVMTQITANQPGVIQRNIEQVLPPFTSLASMVHLAFWTDNLAQKYMDLHPFEVHGAVLWGDEEGLQDELTKVRRDGIFFLPLRKRGNLRAGAPVFGPDQRIHASITVGWRVAEGGDVEQRRQLLGKVIKSEADKLSKAIV